MNFSMPPITWICLAIILVAFIVCFVLVQKFKNSDKLVENRRIVEYFPTFISTLGVLGTFFGITMGLMAFDTTDLDKSIPGLLDGLKTAFFTSLAGMIGSMILSAFIGRKQDEKEGGISDINQAAGTICQAVKQMSDLNKSTIEKLASQMEEQEKDRKAFYSTMGSVMESVKKTQASISESLLSINKSQSAVESEMHSVVINQRSQNEVLFEATGSMINSIGRLEENSTTQTSHLAATQKSIVEIAEFTHHIPDLVDLVEGTVGTQEEINAQVQKLKNILDGEVLQIEESMDKTNQLLERKFDEFTHYIPDLVDLVEGMVGTQEEINAQVQKLKNILDGEVLQIEESMDKTNQLLERKFDEFTHYIPDLVDLVEGMVGTQEEINAQVQKLKNILDGEVLQIEESMDKTNQLLERKFDEFTELLKKSNTEALVEVMKKVTEEFQKQMNSLINKLIQENFDQLNRSVERLNQWQQENKEMISSLTQQYKQMATNFETTSDSLDKVKDDTEALVSEGGKLRKIVDALNEVIVNDERFIKTAEHLQKTAELSQSNMESFDASTKALNGWVRKQRNFVDGVTLLIEKLEEIAKIKDYGQEFWQGTKKNMEEGVGIIKQGSVTLHQSLVDLDRQFYARLNTTLAELDTCIQAMIKGK